MKLGSSIRRRRGSGGRSGSGSSGGGGRRRGVDLDDLRQLGEPLALGLAMALVGLAFGYLVATRAVFPAPAVADDLVAVPDLRGLDRGGAMTALEGAGLELGDIDTIRHPRVQEGEILGQTPLAGQLSNPAGAVAVTVSGGPERRPVPDVVRLQANRAVTVLQATGFSVVVDSVEAELPKGRVVRLDPAPGTEANLPLDVRIFVSRGPPMVEMPRLIAMQEEEALAQLDTLGLVVEVETVFRFGADQGAVIDQDPGPGIRLERGSAVTLTVGRRGVFQRNDRDPRNDPEPVSEPEPSTHPEPVDEPMTDPEPTTAPEPAGDAGDGRNEP
ncbi:MAG: PASTA domain-containing protein [Gemmatimonadota bacterium]